MSKSWYEEIKDYNYEIGKVTDENGHFTQLIWKDSREVGFGVAFNGNSVYTVANYFPCGNVEMLSSRLEALIAIGQQRVSYDMTKYNWDHISEQVFEVYKNCVNS